MAKGKAKSTLLGIQGVVGHKDVPDWGFLYETSLIKDPNYNVGDRVVLPDGRVFRYAKAGNIINKTQYGLKFYNLQTDGIAYKTGANILQTELATSISIRLNAGKSVTKDSLRGGYIVVHTHAVNNDITRGIIGNSATDASNYLTIYIDAPWGVAIAVAFGIETHANPYSDVRLTYNTPNSYTSVAGFAGVKTAKANQYLWLQTWGPIQGNAHGSPGTSVVERTLVFDYEGRVALEDGAVGANDEMQTAGFIIDRTTSGIKSGFFMLQISP